MRRRILISMLLLVSLIGAACGDDSDNTSQSTDSTAGKAATGEPIKIFAIFEIDNPPGAVAYPEAETAAKAAIRAINDAGGVKGRPLELEQCDGKADVNLIAACGRKAAESKPVAIVGAAVVNAGAFLSITGAAGIPTVGSQAFDAAAFTDKLSYPFFASTPAAFAGGPLALATALGKKNVAMVTYDIPAANAGRQFAEKVTQQQDIRMKTVLVDPKAADLSAYVASALAGGTDGISINLSPAQADQFIKQLHESGSKVPFSRFGTVDVENYRKAAAEYEGSLLLDWGPPAGSTNPGYRQFTQEMEAYQKNAKLIGAAPFAWVGVHLFAKVAEGVLDKYGSIDSQKIREYLDGGARIEGVPMLPAVQFKDPIAGTGLPRAFNISTTVSIVRGGEIKQCGNGDYVNPLDPPKSGFTCPQS